MALLLLVAAGLFLRSLQQAATIDAGINVHNVDTLQIDTRIGGYPPTPRASAPSTRLIARLRAVPGVTAVAASRMVPLQGGGIGLGEAAVPGPRECRTAATRSTPDCDVVSPDYFADAAAAHCRGTRLHRPGSRRRGWRDRRQRTVRGQRLAGPGSDRQGADTARPHRPAAADGRRRRARREVPRGERGAAAISSICRWRSTSCRT